LLSFLGLAGLLLLLKAGGQAVGWGFQLQSPVFIASLILLFFVLSLNFLDLIQPWNALTRLGNVGSSKGGIAGQFWAGVLAVAVASPCTGPFMGVAVGSALTRSTAEGLLIFTFIGLGFLSPFLILAWVPGARRLLPKPGMWMEIFRQAMAFPLLFTTLWLLWVLEAQTGMHGVLWILGAFIGLGFATWLWHQLRMRAPRYWILIVVIMGVVIGLALSQQKVAVKQAATQASDVWEAFTPEKVAEARKVGPVFIDFTAAWCVTCQVNKKLVLNREDVQAAFKQAGVKLFRADWTNYDAVITQTLAGFDRQGVPVYVFYADAKGPAKVLPEVLTPDLILKEIGGLP
jgi:thiol:disulfide interchange protein